MLNFVKGLSCFPKDLGEKANIALQSPIVGCCLKGRWTNLHTFWERCVSFCFQREEREESVGYSRVAWLAGWLSLWVGRSCPSIKLSCQSQSRQWRHWRLAMAIGVIGDLCGGMGCWVPSIGSIYLGLVWRCVSFYDPSGLGTSLGF